MDKPIKAMIMSAGVGSRLEPLTSSVPKPLVPVFNKPVMDILFENLVSIGIKDVVCNTYYLANQIINRYKNNNIGINFNYIIEEELSGTAGGVKKCQFFFDKDVPFIVMSADGLTNADIIKGLEIHKKSNAIATIGVKQIPKTEVSHFGVVVTDAQGYITEFQEKPKIEEAKSNYINTGIYIFDYEIFDYIPENTFYDFAKNVFPKLLSERKINTFEIKDYWTDIGTLEQYKQSTKDIFEGKCHLNDVKIITTKNGQYVSNSDNIPESTNFVGYSAIGNNVKIGNNCTIENSIIWDDVVIGDGVNIKDSIVASGSRILNSIVSETLGANSVVDKEIIKHLIF